MTRTHSSGTLIALFLAPIALARDLDMRLHWSEIASAVQDSRVKIVLASGKTIKGRIKNVESEQFVLDNGKSAQRFQVAQIRVRKTAIAGRIAGVSVGAGIATLVTAGLGAPAGVAAKTALMLGGIGYLIGWAGDRKEIVIGILP